MKTMDFVMAKMNETLEFIHGQQWLKLDENQPKLGEEEIKKLNKLFEHNIPKDLIAFYNTYGQFKSLGYFCPMDLSLNDSIGLIDVLNTFFGATYFENTSETATLNSEYKCIGRMWPGDDAEEIHCFYYDVKNFKYGRFYFHQNNGYDITTIGLKNLIERNIQFASMEALILNEIEHARCTLLSSAFECYNANDLLPYQDSIKEVGLIDTIIAFLYDKDHQPWDGIDKKIGTLYHLLNQNEVYRINKDFKSIGWCLKEKEGILVTIFKGKNMEELEFNSDDLKSLVSQLKTLTPVKSRFTIKDLLEDVYEFYTIC